MKFSINTSALVALIIFGATACSAPKPQPEEDETEALVQPEGGKTVRADTANWCEEVVCTGRVDAPPQSQAAVHAPMGGFLRSIRHLPGDFIKQGEPLAQLEHQDIIALQEEYLSTSVKLTYLDKTTSRNALLAAADAVSVKQQEEAQGEKRGLEVRKASLASRLKLIGIDPKRLEDGAALVSSVPLLAPISGYLTSVDAVQGQFISPNDRLFTMVDDTHFHLALQVMAKDAASVKEGMSITYTVTGDSSLHKGEVHRVNKAVDPEKGIVEIHAHLSDNRSLPIGSYVNASICTGTRHELIIPVSALQGEADDRWVWLKENTAYRKRHVELGATQQRMVSIRSGLKLGDEVWIP